MSSVAPAGAVWVCSACGKRARDRAHGGLDHGWDEACVMHAVLCSESSIELDGCGRVVHARAWTGGVPT